MIRNIFKAAFLFFPLNCSLKASVVVVQRTQAILLLRVSQQLLSAGLCQPLKGEREQPKARKSVHTADMSKSLQQAGRACSQVDTRGSRMRRDRGEGAEEAPPVGNALLQV